MARLDPLIEALHQRGAEALVLHDGARPSLVIAGATREVVAQTVSASQISALVAEIAPETVRSSVQQGEPARFEARWNGRTVKVEFGRNRAVLQPGVPQVTDSALPASVPVAEASDAPAGNTPAGPTVKAIWSPTAGNGRGALEGLFRLMVEAGASDLHLSTGAPPLLRVDGHMMPLEGTPAMEKGRLQEMFDGVAPERNRAEFEKENDTDFAYEIPGLSRFRCNLFMDRRGPGGVFRVIPSKILTADDLGLSAPIRELTNLTKGLVLVTGPTGSGKSTTLTALIDLINKSRPDHIITIEDPIEFVHENHRCLVNQREVKLHTGGFKRALRAALREDPDIVLVGEMRDLETVSIALETAETGHLVFGTLHTSSAVSTVDRLVDQFPAGEQGQIRVMLADTLKAVIAQVLCRRKGGGRVAALEVLMAIPAVSNLIREGKTFQIASIMQTGRKQGMVTLTEALMELVTQGVVEPEEAYRKALDKQALLSMFKSKKIPADFLAAQGPAPAGGAR